MVSPICRRSAYHPTRLKIRSMFSPTNGSLIKDTMSASNSFGRFDRHARRFAQV